MTVGGLAKRRVIAVREWVAEVGRDLLDDFGIDDECTAS